MALARTLTQNGGNFDDGSGTISGLSFGTASSDRWLVCLFTSDSTSAPSAATIGGVTATVGSFNGSIGIGLGVVYANVPTGTSGDVVLTFGSGLWTIHALYAVTGAPTIQKVDEDFVLPGGSYSINVGAGGVTMGACINGGSASNPSFTAGLTDDGAYSMAGPTGCRNGSATNASTTSLSVTTSGAGATYNWAISFEPVASSGLTASNFTNASPVLGAPVLTQTHVLTASPLANTSPVLGPAVFPDLFTAPPLGLAMAVLRRPRFPRRVATFNPASRQTSVVDVLTAANLTNTSPVLGPATLTQNHTLTAAALTNTAPAFGPLLATTRLNPNDKDAVVTIDSTGMVFTVPTGNVAGVRSLHSWSSGKHAFSITGIYDEGAIGIGIALAGASRVSEDANSGSATYYQGDWLFYRAGVSSPIDNTLTPPNPTDTITLYCDSTNNLVYFHSALNNDYLFGADPVAGTGGVAITAGRHFALAGADSQFSGYPDVTGTVNFNPQNLASGWSPWGVGDSALETLNAANLTNSAPVLGPPTFSQNHVLSAANLANSAPVLGPATLTQNYVLSAANLANSAPVLGPATLSENGVIAAAALANSSPVLGPATITQKHVLTASNLANSAPVLGAPALVKVLTAANLAPAAPVLGPATITQKHVLSAAALSNSSPDLGAPALGVTGVMSAANLAPASPSIGAPALTQNHTLASAGLQNSVPTLGAPALVANVSLTATALAPNSPVLGPAALTQKHVLSASALAPSAPDIGVPQLITGSGMAAFNLRPGSPVLGAPDLTQRYTLVAGTLAPASPTLGPASYRPNLRAANLAAGSPMLGHPHINPRYFTKPAPLQGSKDNTEQLSGVISKDTNLEAGW